LTLALLDPVPVEVIVVVGDEYRGRPPQAIMETATGLPVKVIHRGAGPFDFSRAVNCGVLASRGELVLMLNDDIEAEDSGWLRRMAARLEDPAVGAVGATLLYPDRSIQHIGIEFDGAQPVHSQRGRPISEVADVLDVADMAGAAARDVVCVTGACLLARRRDLLAVGGMSLEFPASYGDIDLCLRLARSGLKVVTDPTAVLIHHESASREPVIEPWEWERFVSRWGEDPASLCHPIDRADDHADDRADDPGDNPKEQQDYHAPMADDPVDDQDRDQLRHELLRQRDQALGARTRSQFLTDRVANQDDRIAELQERVREREHRIEEWKSRVAERDARIAERDLRMAEKDARIAEQDLRMAEKDARIAELAAESLRLHEDLARPAVIRLARRLVRGPRRDG
ncbi:MAG: glycosyltransferase, partial [bacterium]|nr:glycosyltransferase [bacterium]